MNTPAEPPTFNAEDVKVARPAILNVTALAAARPQIEDDMDYPGTNPLDALFAPRSVAVIGASEKPRSVGRALAENLRSFGGQVYLVNPNSKTILGTRTYAEIKSVPERVDLAVIATPAVTVPALVRQCVNAGVRGNIIISAGFRECGNTGADLEKQISAETTGGSMRIVGPNCLGAMVPHLNFNATFADRMAKAGQIAFLSQSGALCTAVLDWSCRAEVGFSALVSIGSMLDVGWGDLITYFGDDPRTKSIVCYMESIGDARSFLSAAREVALTKPIIVLKVGRTEAAAKAAASHTGSLTGSDDVLNAAFRRAGVLRVDTIEEIFDMAEVLAQQPRPHGPRLAIVTNAGGPGALATDMLIGSGGRLAELSETTHQALDALLPAHWSHGNPIDILGDAGAERYAKAVELAGQDPGVDGVLVILTPQAMTDPLGTAELLRPLANLDGKPILASWMGGPDVEAGRALLSQAGIPTFEYPDSAARAFARMWQYSCNLRALYETPALLTGQGDVKKNSAHIDTVINTALKHGRTLLTEVESKHILASSGIPTVETLLALNEDAAVAHASELGYPVVVKLLSRTITHKSDVGGVQLNLRNAAAIRQAWRAIKISVTEKKGAGHFLGVTVQPMINYDGYELILGSSIDPQFGPVMLFGAGGELVEILKDRALALPPLNATLARRVMELVRIFKALQGTRGRPPVDLVLLEQVLVRFSQLVAEQRRMKEIDINPLLVSGDKIVALDARIVLHDPDIPEDQLPKLAIRPYPRQYVTRWKLKDRTPVVIRPIQPEDEPLMIKFHQTLSARSVYYRYFIPMRIDQRITHERLAHICFTDYDRELALVVERHDLKSGEREILGVGRLSRLHGKNEAEFAIIVSDKWQRLGLGTKLLRSLVEIAREEKIGRIIAKILPENREMQKVARKAGFDVGYHIGDSEYKATLTL